MARAIEHLTIRVRRSNVVLAELEEQLTSRRITWEPGGVLHYWRVKVRKGGRVQVGARTRDALKARGRDEWMPCQTR